MTHISVTTPNIAPINKYRLIFAGTPEFAAISLQALIDQQDELNIAILKLSKLES